MRICYVPSDMDAPGSYRCLFPGRAIQANTGHDVIMPPKELITSPDGKRRWNFTIDFDPPEPRAHVWVLQSRFDRLLAERGIQRLRQCGIVSIADVDDNYEELPAWNPAYWGTHPYRRDDGVIINREARRNVKKQTGFTPPPNKHNRLWLREIFKQVDAMTVSTPYLRDLYSPYNKNIHVVRNYVDWDMWEDIQPQYEVKRWGNRIRIGYSGVFTYRRGDLEVLRPIIRPFLEKHPNVDFVANSKNVHDFLNVPQRQRIVVKEYDFLNIDTGEYAMPRKTATMDIGLVPLAGGGLSEGKSHLKGMEYNAAGIPYISSDSESYRYFTQEGVNGFIAHDASEWVAALECLVSNDEERRNMGMAARGWARDNSIQNNWDKWASVYEEIYGDGYDALARGAIARGAVQKVSELGAVLEMASGLKPRIVLEVGSARGGTFWAMSKVSHPEALLVSVDIPSGSPIDTREGKDVYHGRDRSRFRTFVQEGQRCVLIDDNSQLESTVEKVVDVIGCHKVDLLFIDADHRYEGVKRDFELYSPLVRDGGMIVFHDMIPQNDKRSGVHIFWNEVKESYPHFEFVGDDNWGYGNWGGIGVLRKVTRVRNPV